MKAPSLRGGGLEPSKPLDNPIRRRIVRALSAEERPRNTIELSQALGEPLSVVAYHLGVLQKSGVVRPLGTEQAESAPISLRESALAGDEVAMTRLALAEAEDEAKRNG